MPQTGGRLEVIHRSGKMGLGTAYITGFKHCIATGSDVIGQMDADFSHPLEKLVELACQIENYDIVIGSRYVPGGSVDHQWPLWRKGLSAWGNFYARTILQMPIRDCTGGFRLYQRQALSRMPLDRIRSNGYVFQVEMAYVAHRLGMAFHEIPIYFADRRWGTSKMNLRIQAEAAVRVWQLPPAYHDLKSNHK
jgi:dolichol-phosphate mannosyltransferase